MRDHDCSLHSTPPQTLIDGIEAEGVKLGHWGWRFAIVVISGLIIGIRQGLVDPPFGGMIGGFFGGLSRSAVSARG